MDKSLVSIQFSDVADEFSEDVELTHDLLLHRRQRIDDLEAAIKSIDHSQGEEFADENLTHHFGEGVYARELFIKKHSLIVGKIHKHATFNVLTQGRIAIVSPEEGFKILEAPYTFVSKPLTKRIGLALEDSIFVNCHGTHSRDLFEIEQQVIARNYSDVETLDSMKNMEVT